GPPRTPPRPPPHRAPSALGLADLLATAAWFLYADPAPPYALRPGTEVRLALEQAPDARKYPDAAEIQPGVELLTRVYLQRRAEGDRRGLSELDTPWYTGREAVAGEWIGGVRRWRGRARRGRPPGPGRAGPGHGRAAVRGRPGAAGG
ncbi:hypothetical protein AB8B12_33210, partial [Streptomyces sp. PGLac3x]